MEFAVTMERAVATETEDFEFVAVKQEKMEDLEADDQDPLQVPEHPMMERELWEDNTENGELRTSKVQHGLYTSCSTMREAEDSPYVETDHSNTDHYEPEPCRSPLSEDCKGSWRCCAAGQGDIVSQLYTCSLCLSLFSSKYSLINHVFTHMDGIRPPLHICKLCGEVFDSAAHLSEHSVQRKWHSTPVNIRPSSESSSEFFTKPLIITVSKLVHDEDRKSCDVCGKKFAGITGLNSHKKIHTQVNRYICFCGRTFRTSGFLRYHLGTHFQERPYTCKVCGTSFVWQGSLKIHKCRYKF